MLLTSKHTNSEQQTLHFEGGLFSIYSYDKRKTPLC